MEQLLCTKPTVVTAFNTVICEFSIESNGTAMPVKIEVFVNSVADAQSSVSVHVGGEPICITRGIIKMDKEAVAEKLKNISIIVAEPHEFYKFPDIMKPSDSWVMVTRNLGVVFMRGVVPDLLTAILGRSEVPENWNMLVVSIDEDGEASLTPSGLRGYISKTMEAHQ